MTNALYYSFIADYYDESPIVKGRLQDLAFYRDAARDFGDPFLELGCGTGRIRRAPTDCRTRGRWGRGRWRSTKPPTAGRCASASELPRSIARSSGMTWR